MAPVSRPAESFCTRFFPAAAAVTATPAGQQAAQHGKGAMLLFTAGLLVTFIFVRINTRLIRARVSWWFHDITPGGRHIHHVVFGVILMAVAGLLEFGLRPSGPFLDVIAFAFGAGLALTLDEFALVLNLDDVYWQEEGRRSVDAVVVAAAASMLMLLGSAPVVGRITPGEPVWVLVYLIVTNLLFSLISFSKGKLWTGFVGLWVPIISMVGSFRLARPGSPWARWRYRSRPHKLERAEARFAKADKRRKALRVWAYDRVAGKPSLPPLGRKRGDNSEK